MLRIHFTSDDIARLRVAPTPDPMWEVLLSLHMLPTKVAPLIFGQWRATVRPALDRSVLMLRHLAPPTGYSPDFLTPPVGATCLDDAVDTVLSTPRQRLQADLEIFAAERRSAPWTAGLAGGDTETLARLGTAITDYHQASLAPYWEHIHGRFEADRAARGRAFVDGGHEQLLSTLHPTVRWQPPVLTMRYPGDRDLYLGGRGLLLLPSFFCWRMPITVADPDLPPVLVYPIEHEPGWPGPRRDIAATRGQTALANLIGRTRAAVLEVIAGCASTGQLARRLDISAASASEHVTTLREAGLVVSRREGATVHHTITPLGLALLNRPDCN